MSKPASDTTMLHRVTNVIGTTFLNGGSYEDLARAAIQAIREPTNDMIDAFRQSTPIFGLEHRGWQAAIDKAIEQ